MNPFMNKKKDVSEIDMETEITNTEDTIMNNIEESVIKNDISDELTHSTDVETSNKKSFGKKKEKKQNPAKTSKNKGHAEEKNEEEYRNLKKKEIQAIRQNLKKKDSVQRSIPIERFYPDHNVFGLPNNGYSKTYRIADVNFSIASNNIQQALYEKMQEFFDSFDADMFFQLSVVSRKINKDDFAKNFLLADRSEYQEYIDEYNSIIRQKMAEGQNNLVKEIYLTVTVSETKEEKALQRFLHIDDMIDSRMKELIGKSTVPLKMKERLQLLHSIYHTGDEDVFLKNTDTPGHHTTELDFEWASFIGLSIKDLIAPNYLNFKVKDNDHFRIGEGYGCTLTLDKLASNISSDFMKKIIEQKFDFVTTFCYRTMEKGEARSKLKNATLNINTTIADRTKKAYKDNPGVPSSVILSSDLISAQTEAQNFYENITKNDQNCFLMNAFFTVFGSTLEDIQQRKASMISIANAYDCKMNVMKSVQEHAFNASLPIGYMHPELQNTVMLPTQVCATFMPFTSEEILQTGGRFYSKNAQTRSLIFYDRLSNDNYNGVVLAASGKGKSFVCKTEMIPTIIGSNDDLIIIDPTREYTKFAKTFGGQIIKISPGSTDFINPLDMDINYGVSEDSIEDPIRLKTDNIQTICDTMYGAPLTSYAKSIISRVVRELYQPYVAKMEELRMKGETRSIIYELVPTLSDFNAKLREQPEVEAKNLATSFEQYCTGALDIFAHKTNVNKQSRILVYDVRDIGTSLNELGYEICLNDAWNRIISNGLEGKRTWLYIDEFYTLMKQQRSAEFLQEIFKRVRHWNGIVTAITQDVEDLLNVSEGRTILNNCSFAIMLSQNKLCRDELENIYSLSTDQLKYITDKPRGTGLIYVGHTILPFEDTFPEDTKLFKIMQSGQKVTQR